MLLQVARHDPRPLRQRCGRLARHLVLCKDPQLPRYSVGERCHHAGPQRQAVISHSPGERGRALNDVQTIHGRMPSPNLAFRREVAGIAQTPRTRREKVGLECEDNVSLVEAVESIDRLAKGKACSRTGRIAGHRFILVPPSQGKRGTQGVELRGEGR